MKQSRFHGRHDPEGRLCERPGCREGGEFRAPGGRGPGFDGPGSWRWYCLEHVREFNAGYDWFAGMEADEIIAAQSPTAGWETETRAFKPDAGIDGMPNWASFKDPLDAIGARSASIKRQAASGANRGNVRRFSAEEDMALEAMGLGTQIDRTQLRKRYAELVRRYHPDRNGGDRSYEARLGRVVEAYNLLKASRALA